MNGRGKKYLMWTLYGVLFLMTVVLQTVLFGRARFLGAKLSLVPVVLACICTQLDTEQGGTFGLICGFVWYCSGADGGGATVLTVTAAALLVSFVCEHWLVRNLLSALLMSLGTLLFVQGVLLALKCYLGMAGAGSVRPWLIGTGLSLLACPPLYLFAWAISKLYRAQKI